jgi:hypothetical protein
MTEDVDSSACTRLPAANRHNSSSTSTLQTTGPLGLLQPRSTASAAPASAATASTTAAAADVYGSVDDACSIIVKHGEFSWDPLQSDSSGDGTAGKSRKAGSEQRRGVTPDQAGLLLSPSGEEDVGSGPGVILRDLNFRCGAGDLVCVVGQVGCGKSSLIQVRTFVRFE